LKFNTQLQLVNGSMQLPRRFTQMPNVHVLAESKWPPPRLTLTPIKWLDMTVFLDELQFQQTPSPVQKWLAPYMTSPA